jgi:uncharacterized repeat protein (TIGR01451 family)
VQDETFTYDYTITQADVDAGQVINTATATGTFNGVDYTDTDTETITAVLGPDISLVKTADPTTYNAAGDLITYTFVVTNSGNTTLTDVTVEDPLFGLNFGPVTLAPGASETFTYVYTITQADVDAGQVINTATATGTFNGVDYTDTDTETITAVLGPDITLSKTALPLTYNAAGDLITYTFVVTNSGNTTLTDVTVDDPLFGLNFGPVTLAPGASETFTYVYTITQADVDAGQVINTATATGTFNGVDYTDTDTETITAVLGPDITLSKTALPLTYNAAGDLITYTFLVTNSGNTTLTDVTVDDPLFGLNFGPVTLAPGASETFTYVYTITQADVDAGQVINTATATGTFNGVDYTDTDTETITAVLGPEITLSKTADPTTYNAAGDLITYTFVVTNSGNTTLTDVTVDDPLFGLTFGPVTLAPGASETFTYDYTITQADVDAGQVINTATATGTFNGVDYTDTDSETITAVLGPEITLSKTADPTTYNAAGDLITYTFLVTNSGNTTLTDVTVDDPLFGLNFGPVTLAPGASETFTYDYTITQADVDAGQVINTATATGTFNGVDYTDTDSETITAVQTPSISLSKTADPTTYNAAGDLITYTFLVTNSGNTTLTDVTVDDPLFGLNFGPVTLAPGASETFTHVYTITQADVDAGQVINTATATGTFNGVDYTDTDTETITAVLGPDISLSKTALPLTYNAAGDLITYTFVVTNSGNTTLTDVTVDDPLFGLNFGPVTLAPGASETFTHVYTITQADVDAGQVINTATATGTFNGVDYTDTDTETITAVLGPEITLSKTADAYYVQCGRGFNNLHLRSDKFR